ncbi:WD repeat-containing protein 26 homolog isoform X2 [Cicer arietinum]|uniref:WD repeat-containing protein 26 homolog isoform X2 n=1 Tax=Cicer arietinum TaxID=3827 RepID=A0A1S2Y582_CICAR|nr:WD repeat-containing protein 26 homolog isoform X2 [Cicer arietinum]
MGGVEDEEPALKRMRLSSYNGSSSVECTVGSSSGLMARPLSAEGEDEVIGSTGIIKRREFVRIITKALYSLGYKKSGEHLEEESGIPLQSSVVNVFMQKILDGDWDESLATLNKIGLHDEGIVRAASFLILEQKFFELLDGDKVMDALKTLRTEITQHCVDSTRIRELTSCIVSPSGLNGLSRRELVRVRTRLKLLEELQKLIPPNVMVPEKRLERLVEIALIFQREACMFHNSLDKEISVYSDHHCGKTQIPSRTLQVDTNGGLSIKHKLCGHQKPVSSASWSPNGQELLTCGVEEAVRRWDVSTGKCLQVYEKNGPGLISCAWLPCGNYILSGLNDKSICMWELDGKEVESWKEEKTLKISDLEITGDGEHIISICKENVILLFNKETNDERFIEEDEIITSFCLSKDSRFLLINLLNQEIHLWNIGDLQLVRKYKSHKRARFVIRSCFGGFRQSFIASGSEDSQVYIWHRNSEDLVDVLPGHSGAVNCVSWNPANPHMLASASDDRTIRIWGLKCLNVKYPNAYSNGNHHSNGGELR